MVVRGGRARPLAIFANFFEASDLWPRARVLYGETEISVRMSFGIYRRVCSAVCRRNSLASKCRRRDACVTITQTAPLDLGPPPRRRLHHGPHEEPLARGQQRTRSRIVADGPCRGDAHLYGASCGAGRRQEAVGRRLWVAFLQAHPISPFLFVTTSGDYRSSARDDSPVARNLICRQ